MELSWSGVDRSKAEFSNRRTPIQLQQVPIPNQLVPSFGGLEVEKLPSQIATFYGSWSLSSLSLSLSLSRLPTPVSFIRENRNHLRFGGAAAAIIDPRM